MNNHINSANLGFEKEIFSAADKLRGNIDAAEYKNVVLGLIFLKYISDSFEDRYQELVDEGEGFEEDRDEYLAENIFFVPKEARWDFIASKAMTPEIGQVIDKAMVSIEEENDRLNGILPKNYARLELDKRRLGEVVVLFNNLKLKEHGDSKDILGRTYEYALAQFASLEGKNAGEFYTPSSVVRTLVEILQPYEGRVYDPCCGAGGMFVQSAKFVENHQRRVSELSIFGQESNANTWKLAQMNLAIHALEGDLGSGHADTFFNDLHPTMRADFILANHFPLQFFSSGDDPKHIGDIGYQSVIAANPRIVVQGFSYGQHFIDKFFIGIKENDQRLPVMSQIIRQILSKQIRQVLVQFRMPFSLDLHQFGPMLVQQIFNYRYARISTFRQCG
jgi:type I restriction enzyme M protein